ncbi:tetratricopeptide repeat protein [Leeuwenhoekiella parthenopeia]|uniref:Tetratricopeptide repeat protein n=1 Tax=Leeuwenhoekiella parthenopeia TaxID=2890320 RepID=A0ABS8GPP0_9FLAO|nr:tetratricopeptide repeat protein [Leeuwenhoekiella parthenopeia]MCC4211899.1 tetratricopeptide repeat protein [Leeuwenhoekiella parthenopeia]
MLYGGSSAKGMIDSLRNNRKLLRKNSKFKKDRSFLNLKETDLKGATGKPTFNAYSKEAIRKIKIKFKRRRKREKVFFVFLGFIGLFLFVSLGRLLVKDVLRERNDSRQEQIKKNERLYLKHIEFGDRWFSQGKWKNAIFYYKQGVELYPDNYEINYRLVRTYSLHCKNELENCTEAKALLDDMLIKFSDKETQLAELKEVLNFEYGI